MKSKQITTEDKFNNKWGFVISCIGSSVGMANIWLFPYRAGEFGGAAFLIPYIIFVVLIGFTGVIGEMAFGRAMQSGPLGAFKKAYEMKGQNLAHSSADPRYRIARNRNRLQRHHRLDLEIFCRLDHRKNYQ